MAKQLDIRWYLIWPNGKLKLNADNEETAMHLFDTHWSANVTYNCKNPKRKLIREVRYLVLEEEVDDAPDRQ